MVSISSGTERHVWNVDTTGPQFHLLKRRLEVKQLPWQFKAKKTTQFSSMAVKVQVSLDGWNMRDVDQIAYLNKGSSTSISVAAVEK